MIRSISAALVLDAIEALLLVAFEVMLYVINGDGARILGPVTRFTNISIFSLVVRVALDVVIFRILCQNVLIMALIFRELKKRDILTEWRIAICNIIAFVAIIAVICSMSRSFRDYVVWERPYYQSILVYGTAAACCISPFVLRICGLIGWLRKRGPG